jgi:hypothetical protein
LPIFLRDFYLKRLQTYYKTEAKELEKELKRAKTDFPR